MMQSIFENPDLKEAIPNYLAILEGKKKPGFIQKPELLKQKVKQAFKVLENCGLCERNCFVNRKKGYLGFCRLSDKMIISSYFEHFGEEYFFVPSFTIFFLSCSFRCVFCQNWPISQNIEHGMQITEKELAKVIDDHSYCRNVNFVGGDPTPHLPFILKTLSYVKKGMPTVWNSNFYMSMQSMDLLKGMVDVYLPDFKYGNDKCALRLSKVPHYTEIIKRNHLLAHKDSEMVIRHLVMPNHFECCTKPVLEWISENFGRKVITNIMPQYRPEYKAAEYPDISRPLKDREFEKVVKFANTLDLNYII